MPLRREKQIVWCVMRGGLWLAFGWFIAIGFVLYYWYVLLIIIGVIIIVWALRAPRTTKRVPANTSQARVSNRR